MIPSLIRVLLDDYTISKENDNIVITFLKYDLKIVMKRPVATRFSDNLEKSLFSFEFKFLDEDKEGETGFSL